MAMPDRKPKPHTTQYLLRDVPKSTLKKAKEVLALEGRTLKWELLRVIEKIATRTPRV